MRNLKPLLLGAIFIASASLIGCSTSGDGERSAGRVTDDRNIENRVEKSLREEPVYKFTGVDVRTFNGVVQLSGFVDTEDQKARAGEIAKRTPGVVQVVNNVTLKELSPTGRIYATTNEPAIQNR